MASVSRLGWLLLVTLGLCACEEPYEPGDPRINAPINLRNAHRGSTVAAFGIEEVSRRACQLEGFYVAEVRLSEVYNLDSCHYEEQVTTTIFTDDWDLDNNFGIQWEDETLVTLGERDEVLTEECDSRRYVQWTSPVETYDPLTKSEMVMILRDEHDVVCSSSGEQLE